MKSCFLDKVARQDRQIDRLLGRSLTEPGFRFIAQTL